MFIEIMERKGREEGDFKFWVSICMWLSFLKSYTCIKFANILGMGSLIQSNAQITLTEMLDHFQDKRYAQGRGFITKTINSCHTSSLSTPEDKEQAQQINVSLLSRFLTQTTEAVRWYYHVVDYWRHYNR